MASARRLTSRLFLQTHNIQAQRRLYSKKPASRNPIPKVNAGTFDTTFDIAKAHRTSRDGGPLSSSELQLVKALRTRRDGGPMSSSDLLLFNALRDSRNGEPMSFSDRLLFKMLCMRRPGGPMPLVERKLVAAVRAKRDFKPLEMSFSEFLRKEVKTPMSWIHLFITCTVVIMLPPWEDNPENRKWVEKHCPWASCGLVKTKRQREEEESAGADHQGCGSKEDESIDEWTKMEERDEENAEGFL